MYRNNPKLIRDGAVAILAAFLLQVIGIWGFPPALFFFAVPLVVFATMHGRAFGSGLVVISGLFLLAIMDWVSALIFSGIALLFVLFLPYAFKKNMPSSQAIIIAALALLFASVGGLLFEQRMGTGITQDLERSMRELISLQIETLRSSGLDSIDMIDLEYALRTALQMMVQVIPGLIFVMSFIASLIQYSTSAWILRYTGYGIMDAGRFNRFRLPNNILLGALLTFAATYVMGLFGFPYTDTLYLNLLTAFGIVFFVQGLAVADCFFARRFGLITRLLLPTFLVVVLQAGIVFVFVGILDVGFKFRDRITYKRGE